MRKAMIVAAGLLVLAATAEAKSGTATKAANAATRAVKANATIYKRELSAAAKAERAALANDAAYERQAIEQRIAATTNPVAKAQLRVQLAQVVANVKAIKTSITEDVKLARAQAMINVGANGGAVPRLTNVLSTFVGQSGVMIVTVQDSEGGISIIQVN